MARKDYTPEQTIGMLREAEVRLSQGVASGHPMPDSVVLWTRLMVEDPARRPGGAPTVDWTVAEDERLEKVVRSGQATAEPA